MLEGMRSRLTYANVMATVAVFLALGGGAYALSGVPDQSGVYHGCVSTPGALRVVAKASSCQKAKTVRRGNRRVRIPGESAIAWNQQGPRGLQGLRGLQGTTGLKGDKGDQGLVGPTMGFAQQNLSGAAPSATPDSGVWEQAAVTTPSSGRLFVFARGLLTQLCTGTTIVQVGLYVDGTPVPVSGEPMTAGTAKEIATWGVSGTVSAGAHTVTVQADCVGGTPPGGSMLAQDGAVGGIFVGS